MTNRILGPTSPDPSRSGGSRGPSAPGNADKFKKVVEQVEKVGEVDLDQQRKKSLYESPDETEESDPEQPTSYTSSSSSSQSSSSPQRLSSSGSYSAARSQEGFEDLGTEAIATPSSDPAPSLGSPTPSDDFDFEDLPQSDHFWQGMDMPDEPPQQNSFQETPRSFSSNRNERQTEPQKSEQSQESPSSSQQPHRKTSSKNKSTQLPSKKEKAHALKKEPLQEEPLHVKEKTGSLKKKDIEEQAFLPSALPEESKQKTVLAQKISAEKLLAKKEKGEEAVPPDLSEIAQVPPGTVPIPKREETGQKSEKKSHGVFDVEKPEKMSSIERQKGKKDSSKDQKEHPSGPITLPDPLPPPIQQTSQTIQNTVASYLNPQTAALFRQMVGTILFMSIPSSGITRTEVILNSPAFQGSIFYNAKITLEKYDIAPDAFNITLSGSEEAVETFQQNMSNLQSIFASAYDNRQIKFRVGRLETSLAPDRALFRRKERAGEGESGGEGGQSKGGKK